MGEMAGAFADAMNKASDKDRVAFLQAKIEAIVAEHMDELYPSLEGAKAVRVMPNLDGVKGPDGERLSLWLQEQGVDPAWMVLQPFVVDYEDGFIDYEEYLHTTEGAIVYAQDMTPKKRPCTVRLKDGVRLPDLEKTVVEVLRR